MYRGKINDLTLSLMWSAKYSWSNSCLPNTFSCNPTFMFVLDLWLSPTFPAYNFFPSPTNFYNPSPTLYFLPQTHPQFTLGCMLWVSLFSFTRWQHKNTGLHNDQCGLVSILRDSSVKYSSLPQLKPPCMCKINS